MKITSLKKNREFRQKRVRAIAMSFNEKNLSKVIKAEQLVVTQYLAETFAIAQKRGWINPDIDLVALSYFFRAYLSGMFCSTSPTKLNTTSNGARSRSKLCNHFWF